MGVGVAMEVGAGPPPAVVEAFGAAGEPERLPGGQGVTWRVGDVVLKSSDGAELTDWRNGVLASLPVGETIRVPRPLRTHAGSWLAQGWEATRFVAGDADPARIDDVVRAGQAFHDAVAAVRRPAFLAVRRDPWSYGDRVAAAELPIAGCRATMRLLNPLAEARRPVRLPAQIVHGDLAGNVLFADGLPPAVIDWSPYWRPPSWAAAVAVVDALCWYGAPPDVVHRWSHLPEWRQMLIRALIYRIATREAMFGVDGPAHEPNEAYEPVMVSVLGELR